MQKCKLVSIVMAFMMLISIPCIVDAKSEIDTIPNVAAKSSSITIDSMPSNYKYSIEWVWNNRMVK